MPRVYTAEEIADLLEIELGDVRIMAEQGRLSGFVLGDAWRISEPALLADLERFRSVERPARPLPLAPLDALDDEPDVSERTPLENIEATHDLRERFKVRIEVQNDSEYTGDFRLSIEAEGDRDLWESFEGAQCDLHDSVIQVRGKLMPGDVLPLFSGTLNAKLGDRLFLTVPEQAGIDRLAERVYVLDSDADLKLTIVEGGVFGKRNSLRFKRL